ncbi:GroES-like protein [Auricularia subglabra TFB-10046 SS5]|nr:GroES-like protein [Auricularia subglabra TFB-10046 SS5]
MSTHKSFYVATAGALKVIDVPTPTPGPDEVLVKVAYTSLVPLDVEVAENGLGSNDWLPFTPGYNVAGTVVKVGVNVNESVVKAGDKVVAFALPTYGPKGKGGQEYAVLPYQALAKVPSNVSLAAAAAIPDNFVTAWWILKHYLKLSLPAEPGKQPWSDRAFLIYGAGSTTGQYALQVLSLFGATNVIAVASRSNHALLKSLGASSTIDYHDADWPQQVLAANGGKPVDYAIDIIATGVSLRGVAFVTNAQSGVAIALPIKLGHSKIIKEAGDSDVKHVWELTPEQNPFNKAIELGYVRTFLYYTDKELYENLQPKILPALLARGLIKPTATKIIDESQGQTILERVKAGFALLRSNAVSGYKVIVKIQAE